MAFEVDEDEFDKSIRLLGTGLKDPPEEEINELYENSFHRNSKLGFIPNTNSKKIDYSISTILLNQKKKFLNFIKDKLNLLLSYLNGKTLSNCLAYICEIEFGEKLGNTAITIDSSLPQLFQSSINDKNDKKNQISILILFFSIIIFSIFNNDKITLLLIIFFMFFFFGLFFGLFEINKYFFRESKSKITEIRTNFTELLIKSRECVTIASEIQLFYHGYRLGRKGFVERVDRGQVSGKSAVLHNTFIKTCSEIINIINVKHSEIYATIGTIIPINENYLDYHSLSSVEKENCLQLLAQLKLTNEEINELTTVQEGKTLKEMKIIKKAIISSVKCISYSIIYCYSISNFFQIRKINKLITELLLSLKISVNKLNTLLDWENSEVGWEKLYENSEESKLSETNSENEEIFKKKSLRVWAKEMFIGMKEIRALLSITRHVYGDKGVCEEMFSCLINLEKLTQMLNITAHEGVIICDSIINPRPNPEQSDSLQSRIEDNDLKVSGSVVGVFEVEGVNESRIPELQQPMTFNPFGREEIFIKNESGSSEIFRQQQLFRRQKDEASTEAMVLQELSSVIGELRVRAGLPRHPNESEEEEEQEKYLSEQNKNSQQNNKSKQEDWSQLIGGSSNSFLSEILMCSQKLGLKTEETEILE
eukprot:c21567_g1_i3.p1 GENE.c21567_g1_i3~~c21567_g1_i3.p1  ORF type:complete len:651 (+),score=230.47 c21567_g1_i3:1-1953(+)